MSPVIKYEDDFKEYLQLEDSKEKSNSSVTSNSVKPDGFKVPQFGFLKKKTSEIRKSLPKRETRSKTSGETQKRFEEMVKTKSLPVETTTPVEPEIEIKPEATPVEPPK
jgi:hypothetical protein